MSEACSKIDHSCKHCGEKTLNPLYNREDKEKLTPFCCNGCRAVFNLLSDKGLSQYYAIKESSDSSNFGPVSLSADKFSYLDDGDFINEFCKLDEDGKISLEFYLEGVHCLACLWLIEKTPEFINGVKQARLNLGTGVANFTIAKGQSLSEVACEINKLGYTPHPLNNTNKASDFRKKEDRSTLTKIGVAGAMAGNIMLYSVGLYAGADGLFAKSFETIAFALCIPVLLYSATPFYHSAFSAMKRKTLSIDIPIVFAVWLAFVVSIVNYYRGTGEIYFDLIATLIFLISLARYLMKKASQKGMDAEDLGHFFNSGQCLRFNKETEIFEPIHSKHLSRGDIIKVLPTEMIPADGIVQNGSSYVNTSLITGESVPSFVEESNGVFSGTVNQQSELIIKVEKTGEFTRVGEILKEVEKTRHEKAPIVTKADTISKYFVVVVLALAAVTFTYLAMQGMYEEAITRSLALIIISCPCALGMATPLAMTKSLMKATELGIIIKDETILEKAGKLKKLVIDKTGTLTHGKFSVSFSKFYGDEKELASIAYSLEKRSLHPLAKGLCEFLESTFELDDILITDFKEVTGVGLFGTANNSTYSIRKLDEDHREICDNISTQIGLYEGQLLKAKFGLKDLLRSDSFGALKAIKSLGITPILASGDHHQVVTHISDELAIEKMNSFSEMSPEAKGKLIESLDSTIMVGDGANDALAISKADLGIAVQGSVDVSLRAADAYLTKKGITPIVKVLELSKETIGLVHRNLFFSLIYNALGCYAAMVGWVTPLWAAIFMPASSLTVLLSTIAGTRKMRKLRN